LSDIPVSDDYIPGHQALLMEPSLFSFANSTMLRSTCVCVVGITASAFLASAKITERDEYVAWAEDVLD
jgi:hypothetical protein